MSPACQNCYAEAMSHRLKAMGVNGYADGFKLTLLPERLADPMQRKRSTIYFVNPMNDLFHERIPASHIRQVFDVMKKAPQHAFQVLTKRADKGEGFVASYDASHHPYLAL
jgi:protein gp37